MLLRRYLAYPTTRGFERRSIARKAASIRRYFAYALRRGLIADDPARRLTAPSGPAKLPRTLTTTGAFRSSWSCHPRPLVVPTAGPRDGAREQAPRPPGRPPTVELLYPSELRVSECCGLDLDGLDLRAEMVTVWGKGSKEQPCAPAAPRPVQAATRLILGDPRSTLMDATSPSARQAVSQRACASG